MYATGDAPTGSETAMISVNTAATFDESSTGALGVLNIAHIDESNKDIIGYEKTPAGDSITKRGLCCDAQMKSVGTCENVGQLYLGVDLDAKVLQNRAFTLAASPMSISHTMEVKTTGDQLVAFIFCPLVEFKCGGVESSESCVENGPDPVDITGSLSFQNPYGYLSGKSFGFFPFYAGMVLLYLVLLIFFLVQVIRHIKVLLWLQYCIFGLICLGFVEVCAWFFMYFQLNTSGDAVCCPLNRWAVVAVLLNVAKRTVSRCLLIAICLGFGVVRPKLPIRTTALIGLLGASFFGFATYADIRINSDATPKDNDYWTLPVTTLDMIFVVWTYHGLTQVQLELERLKQSVKLKMYIKLKSVLLMFVALWMVFAVVTILIAKEYVPLTWPHQWILHSFWHIAYFTILMAASITWRPSPQSQEYAYSFQIPSSAEEAEAYEMDITTDTAISDTNIEMTTTKRDTLAPDDDDMDNVKV